MAILNLSGVRGGLSKDAFHETRVQMCNEGSDESHLLSRVFEDDPGTQMEGRGEGVVICANKQTD